jgi:hemolysin D
MQQSIPSQSIPFQLDQVDQPLTSPLKYALEQWTQIDQIYGGSAGLGLATPESESLEHFTARSSFSDTNIDPDTDTTDDAADWSNLTQEALNSLPQAWTRGLLYLLAVFTAIILPWSMMFKVDEVGSARGRLEPKGKTYRIDAPVSGTVSNIRVKEGQTVEAGDSLLELNKDLILADLRQLETKREGEQTRLTQLESVRAQLQVALQAQRSQAQSSLAQQSTQIMQIEDQIRANQAAIASSHALSQKDGDRVNRFRALKQEGILSGVQLEDAEREQIQNQEKLQQAEAALVQSQSELQKQRKGYDRISQEGDLLSLETARQLEELQARVMERLAEIRQTETRIRALQLQLKQHVLRSPVSGRVYQLPIQNPGAVVQPGQLVAHVAPKGAKLVLRSQIESQESGFLRVGLPVKVKFDAYPFQDYGIVSGRVSWVSPDSKPVQTVRGQREVFELEVELEQMTLEGNQRQAVLTPGQGATAEIIIRQRRVIDFFLDPFRQMRGQGLEM